MNPTDPNQLQKSSTNNEKTPLLFHQSHHLEAIRRLRSLVCISVIINALLVVTILALTIYAVITLHSYDIENVTERPVLTSSISSQTASWPLPSESPLGIFNKAAAAADNGICSEIGRNILIKGGNAVDAAIAAQFCTGVTDPQSSGLGGGHFMTIYNSSSKMCQIIDARETAPKATNKWTYANDTYSSELGYTAVAVPGELAGLWTAYKHYGSGRVLWADLLLPTIELCEKGYPVSGYLAEQLILNEDFIFNETSLHIFIRKDTNKTYGAGEIMKRPDLAATLKKLAFASDPIQMFYNSTMTSDMVSEIQNGGGFITEEDFSDYQLKWGHQGRPAITMPLKGNTLTMCGPPPPSSASIVAAVLNVLDGFNITFENISTIDSNVDLYHKLIESMKFAQSVRQHMGDIDFEPHSLDIAKNITSLWYGDKIRTKILPTAQSESYYEIGPPLQDHGTSHLSVVDSEGNAVSLTASINWHFGAKVRSESTGIIWNNEMDDFSQPFYRWPKSNNFIASGKRPLSSMSPVVVYDSNSGDVKMVAGGCGGGRIVSAVSQVLFRALYLNQTVKEAIDCPRLHTQLHPLLTEFEYGFPSLYIDGLRLREQHMTRMHDDTSATAIYRSSDGKILASSDYRKQGGYSAGY